VIEALTRKRGEERDGKFDQRLWCADIPPESEISGDCGLCLGEDGLHLIPEIKETYDLLTTQDFLVDMASYELQFQV